MKVESLVYSLIVTLEDFTSYKVLCWYCRQILTTSGDVFRGGSVLEIPERAVLGGCEKHQLNGTTKLLKDKHKLLMQQGFFQTTIKMSENCGLCRKIYRCVPMMLANSQILGRVC